MSQAKALYQLQQIERSMTKAQKRLREIADELGNDSVIQVAQKQVQAAETKLAPLQKQARELEHEIEAGAAKAKESEDRMYDGSVTNPKELQDIHQEVESLRARGDKLEESLLTLMMSIEEAEGVLNDAQENLQQTMAERAGENQDLLDEQAALQAEQEAKRAELEAARAPIDAETLAQYEALKPKTRGRAVAEMRDDSCSLCGVQQNRATADAVRMDRSIINCSNCGRILIYVR